MTKITINHHEGSDETITGLFRKSVAEHPDNIAIHFFSGKWHEINYSQLFRRSAAIASCLLRNGAVFGDRIAIISENRPEWNYAYLSILMSGCIAVPVDAQLGPEEARTLLLDAGVCKVFCSSKTDAQLSLFLREYSNTNNVHTMVINFDSPAFDEMLKSPVDELPEAAPDSIASIIYTSGTTGNPKGVILTHHNFCSDAKALIAAGLVSSADSVLAILPLHHTYSFMCTLLVPFIVGASVAYPQSMKGHDLLSAIHDRGVTVLVGVPQLLTLIRNSVVSNIEAQPLFLKFILKKLIAFSGFLRRRFDINVGKIVFGSIHKKFGRRFRFFTSGGAKLDADVMKGLEAIGFTVLEGYGLTETSPVVTFNPMKRRKPGSAGLPLPTVSIRISNPSETGEGEIEVKGPMVMQGYYKRPESTDDVIHDGWLRTGDIGFVDKDGYLFITGRSKEVIVLASGKNIYPEEVEKKYMASKYIKELCITSSVHGGIETSLHAVIVPDLEYARQAGISNINETLKWEINAISAMLPSYMRINGFTLQKEPLPRTPLGKLRRFKIQESLKRPMKVMRPAGVKQEFIDEIGGKVLNAIRKIAKTANNINGDDNLELDLGLDSLLKIELTTLIERDLSVKLSEDFMSGIFTVRELIEKLRMTVSTVSKSRRAANSGWKAVIAEDPAEKIVLEPEDALMLPSRIAHAVLRLLMCIMFRLEAKETSNIPRAGSYILAANHTSYLDGLVLVLSLPFAFFKNLYSLGLSDFFAGSLKDWFAKMGHVVPIDASSFLNHALQTSAYLLRNGRAVCIYPEGGRSPDGSLLEFKKGVGIIAVEMGVPVVPVYIKGAFEAMPRTAKFPRFSKITVTFGRPLSASDVDFSKRPIDMDEYQYFVSLLREKVQELSESA